MDDLGPNQAMALKCSNVVRNSEEVKDIKCPHNKRSLSGDESLLSINVSVVERGKSVLRKSPLSNS